MPRFSTTVGSRTIGVFIAAMLASAPASAADRVFFPVSEEPGSFEAPAVPDPRATVVQRPAATRQPLILGIGEPGRDSGFGVRRRPQLMTAGGAMAIADFDDSTVTARRLNDAVCDRLQSIGQRVRERKPLRSAGTIVGLGAIAAGALGGQPALTFVGTQAVRAALDRQFSALRTRTGVSVDPSIGRRSFFLTLSWF